MANPALDTTQRVLGYKIKPELKEQIIKQVITDSFGGEVNKLFKQVDKWG
jgi:hypothetical protein